MPRKSTKILGPPADTSPPAENRPPTTHGGAGVGEDSDSNDDDLGLDLSGKKESVSIPLMLPTKRRKTTKALGEDESERRAERMLEKVVFGGEQAMLDLFDKSETKEVIDEVSDEELFFIDRGDNLQGVLDKSRPKPAWEDEDDDQITLDLTGRRKHQDIRRSDEKEISGDKLKQRLKSQFENLTGSKPNWAKLESEKDERKRKGASSDEEDEEEEDLLKRTGDYLASSKSLTKGLLDIKKYTDANKMSPSESWIESVEFHPNAHVLLTAGKDLRLNLFQVDGKSNPKIQSVYMEKFPITTAHFSTNGEEVIMSSKCKWFYVYDMIAGKIINIPYIRGINERKLEKFEVSPDGQYLAFLGSYGQVYLLSAKTKEWISTLKMNGSVEAVAFSKDGKTLYSTGDDGEVYVWNLQSRKCVHRFADEGCVKGTSIAVSPSSMYLACGSHSGVVNVYNHDECLSKSRPKPSRAIKNLTTPCTKVLFNSTNEILAIASCAVNKAIRLVHLPSYSVFSNFPELNDRIGRVNSMDFSPRSGFITLGNNKGQALLYRLKHFSES
ncbi:U3 small nucleolar RNA-associated protein 18 homolog [Anneissia japonica]|uniref:U3 small nucleolar RNA-associated protein 18 homolog n=1 Tax=Anneissia japonica TaxID=1529436 RepID=UPI0014258DE3|nr:U3 small nucleolar RNA-associated protein 18 homolog [Anneissia japonica]